MGIKNITPPTTPIWSGIEESRSVNRDAGSSTQTRKRLRSESDDDISAPNRHASGSGQRPIYRRAAMQSALQNDYNNQLSLESLSKGIIPSDLKSKINIQSIKWLDLYINSNFIPAEYRTLAKDAKEFIEKGLFEYGNGKLKNGKIDFEKDVVVSGEDMLLRTKFEIGDGGKLNLSMIAFFSKSDKKQVRGLSQPEPKFQPPSIRAGEEDDSQSKISALAKHIYKTNIYYHGTTSSWAEVSRVSGMDPSAKIACDTVDYGLESGALKIQDELNPGFTRSFNAQEIDAYRNQAMSNFYVTQVKANESGSGSAKKYAEIASRKNQTPKIIRLFLGEESFDSFVADPDSRPEDRAWRTAKKIQPGSVLPSKKSSLVGITLASEEFKEEFNRSHFRPLLNLEEVILDSQQAAAMLRAEQTDSDEDFR